MRVVPAAILRILPIGAPGLGARTTHCLTLTTTLLLLSACGIGDLPKSGSPTADSTPPTIRIVQPSNEARIEGDSLTIDVEYADQGSGIAVNSFKALVNGQDYSGSFDQHNRGASGRIAAIKNLALGENKITVEVADRAGNLAKAEHAFLSSGGGWITITSLIRSSAETISSLALSPNGTVLAAGLKDGTVLLWQVANWEPRELAVLKGHRGQVTALAFSNDGRELASGGEDRTVRLWNMTSPQPRETKTLRGHGLSVTALAFSPDSRRLASGSADRTVRLWDIHGAEPKSLATLTGHSRVVSALVFSPNSQRLASGSADGLIRLWEMIGANIKGPTKLTGHGLRVIALAFARDGQILASSSTDRTLRLWDIGSAKPRERAVLAEYADLVQALAFVPTGKALTSVGAKKVTRWDAGSGKVLNEVALPLVAQRAVTNGDALRVATRHENGVLYVFSLTSNNP